MDTLPVPNTSLPSQMLIQLLNTIFIKCRQTIGSHNQILPLYNFNEQFNPKTLRYQLIPSQPFNLTTGSLAKFVRLLELMKICIDNLQQGKTITKRNLFYKLEQYYENYAVLDKDLKMLCQNLYQLYLNFQTNCVEIASKVIRNDLGIIASNRCILFGPVELYTDGRCMNILKNQIITLPTCRTISGKCSTNKIIIIEKESMFYEIVSVFKQHKLYNEYLILSAKGYPDQTTRNILLQLMNQKHVESIYYLGDYDVFGMDIFLFYTLGDWFCEGLLPKIEIIELGRTKNKKIFDWRQLKQEINTFNKKDEKKVQEIRIKWFQKIMVKVQTLQLDIQNKMKSIIDYFEEFVKEKSKCELELFSERAYSRLWLHQLIQSQSKSK